MRGISAFLRWGSRNNTKLKTNLLLEASQRCNKISLQKPKMS